MTVLRIDPWADGRLAVELKDIFAALPPRLLEASWTVHSVPDDRGEGTSFDSIGEGGMELAALVSAQSELDGPCLLEIAKRTDQIIWGEFRCVAQPGAKPQIVIRAIDSTFFEVISDDDCVFAAMRKRFPNACTLADVAWSGTASEAHSD